VRREPSPSGTPQTFLVLVDLSLGKGVHTLRQYFDQAALAPLVAAGARFAVGVVSPQGKRCDGVRDADELVRAAIACRARLIDSDSTGVDYIFVLQPRLQRQIEQELLPQQGRHAGGAEREMR